MEEKTAFSVNQKVVYPSQGVGRIVEIKEKMFKNERVLYYVIYIEISDMTIMTPVNKAEELGIRAIVSAEEANAALELISSGVDQITSDWKLRYQTNLDLLKRGSVVDIATIVRSLYHRSKIKELPVLERKLYDSARKILEEEISYALDISREDAENLIHKHLEPSGYVAAISAVDSQAEGNEDDFQDVPDLLDDESDTEYDTYASDEYDIN